MLNHTVKSLKQKIIMVWVLTYDRYLVEEVASTNKSRVYQNYRSFFNFLLLETLRFIYFFIRIYQSYNTDFFSKNNTVHKTYKNEMAFCWSKSKVKKSNLKQIRMNWGTFA